MSTSLARHILERIDALGYITGETNLNGWHVMVAEPTVRIGEESLPTRRMRQMVRIDGEDEESRYKAAVTLAVMCGVDLE